MSRKALTVLLALATIAIGGAASANDVYQFRLNRGIYAVMITTGCDIDGAHILTGAVINSPSVAATTAGDIESVVWAEATLTVCTRFGDVAQEAAPIPMHVSLLRNPDLLAVGQTVNFAIDPSPVAHMFHGINPPDLAVVQRRSANTFVFRYVESATGDVIIGPITIELTSPSELQSIPGYDPSRHLPILVLKVVYPIKWLFLDYDEEFSFRIVAFGGN
jgi:hypothetical protein